MSASQKDCHLLTRRSVAERLAVCTRTIARRERDDPQFPQPIKLHQRIYFRADEVDAYERALPRAMLAEAS
jgi:predicted DNA-binding transcriptional regulator AlpA